MRSLGNAGVNVEWSGMRSELQRGSVDRGHAAEMKTNRVSVKQNSQSEARTGSVHRFSPEERGSRIPTRAADSLDSEKSRDVVYAGEPLMIVMDSFSAIVPEIN